jgi:hypothetical protein
VTNGARTRKVKIPRNRARGAARELEQLMRKGRGLPRKVRQAMTTQPEVVLAAVGGAFFLAGAMLGSRLGRALLSAAIPIGVERLLTGEVGPRLMTYAKEIWREVDGHTHVNGSP